MERKKSHVEVQIQHKQKNKQEIQIQKKQTKKQVTIITDAYFVFEILKTKQGKLLQTSEMPSGFLRLPRD